MFNIEKGSTIYVLAPAKAKTGGPELAHQLVFEMNKYKPSGVNIFITYYYAEGIIKKEYTDPSFKKYIKDFKTIDDIEDNEKNIIITTETFTEILDKFDNIQKAIYWMSVDNFTLYHSIFFHAKNHGWPRAIKRSITGQITPFFKLDKKVVHFYQSEYAKYFLEKHGAKKIYRLSDYLNDSYLTSKSKRKREDIVLYNPKKGYEFTKKIIKQAKNITFKPLINLSNKEVKELLETSKVYIDFGNHPGKDRFPREAAISGCCVITGKRGSAAFYNDVSIPDDYKFDDKKSNIKIITRKIQDCFKNFDKNSKNFGSYRKKIQNEHKEFSKDVKAIFCKRP